MKILLYTHSDYSWVWKYWHQQTDKFLKNFQKICMINSNSLFREDYQLIKYDDKKDYRNRILSCLDYIDDEEVILFCHEDMFLYENPNFDILNEYIDLIKNENCGLIKLIRAFEDLEKSNLHEKLFKNPDEQLFSTVTRGSISALRKRTVGSNDASLLFIQSDAAITGGNSGGPMFDEYGNVIAITVSRRIDANAVNFFIPVGEALKFLNIKQTPGQS